MDGFMRFGAIALGLITLAACGNPSRNPNDNGGHPDSMSDCTMDGAHRCLGASYQTCTGGMWMNAIDCPVACSDALGCVECTPGLPLCKDGNVWSCNDDGTPGGQVQECTGGNTCVGGGCVDACADAAANKSYIACEYWAVDLDNAVEVLGGASTLIPCKSIYGVGQAETLDVCYRAQGTSNYAGLCDPPNNGCPTGYACTSRLVCVLDAQRSPFAIVVSNPQAKDATVTVTGPGGQTITQTISANQVSAIMPQAGNAIPDQSVDGTILTKNAYKVTSTLPIVAYQFNPLNNVDVFSNDASLLIPRTTFDTDYYTLSWPTLDRRTVSGPTPSEHNYYGYLTIVAWQDGTQIAVTPTTTVQASATLATIPAGTTASFTLNAFQVLQLQAVPGAAPAGDLTGTHISSPNMMTFGVFGGHEAAFFGETTPPDAQHTRPCCADHLEEMLFPSSTWGKEFAIARSKQRLNEPDLLRVLAQKDGTTVTFTPAPVSMSASCSAPLAKGAFCEVKIMGNTEISASDPILVGHFLEQAEWYGSTGKVGTGDPSMAVAVPTEQYRKDYAFLVPSQYTENYVSISAPATGGVTVDGIAVTMTTFPGGGTHRGAIVPVPAGQHKVTCADGCGILVYGYSDDVSYMFAGGLDLKPIVIF